MCSSVNIAGELSYAPDAAPPIWPPLHPYLLLLHSHFSVVQFLSFTHLHNMLRGGEGVCVSQCVFFLDVEAFSTPLILAYDN